MAAITSDVDICNLALHKIGHDSIDALTDENDAARHCNALYAVERDMMLAAHPWSFALRRIEYDIEDYQDTITATTAADPVVVTGTDISDAEIENNLGVYIWDTGISDLDGNVFVAMNVDDGAETFELYKRDGTTSVDGSDYGTASAGYVRLADILSEYTYVYKLPSTCLRVYKTIDADYEFAVENGYLFVDNDNPQIKYIEKVTEVSSYPTIFIMALATKLAAELCEALAGKSDRKLRFLTELEKVVLPRAQRLNAIEQRPKTKGRKTDPDELTSWQKAGR